MVWLRCSVCCIQWKTSVRSLAKDLPQVLQASPLFECSVMCVRERDRESERERERERERECVCTRNCGTKCILPCQICECLYPAVRERVGFVVP